VFEDAVRRVRVAALGPSLDDLDRRIEKASGENEKRTLTEEKARLSRERREVAPDDWSRAARRLRAGRNPNPKDR
jgi:hypothetical protein